VRLPAGAPGTNTMRDPELMEREGRRLEQWIDTLA
jgi:hypothetical protein